MDTLARLFPIAGVSGYPGQGSRCEGRVQPAERGPLDTAPCTGHLTPLPQWWPFSEIFKTTMSASPQTPSPGPDAFLALH